MTDDPDFQTDSRIVVPKSRDQIRRELKSEEPSAADRITLSLLDVGGIVVQVAALTGGVVGFVYGILTAGLLNSPHHTILFALGAGIAMGSIVALFMIPVVAVAYAAEYVLERLAGGDDA